jgi:hypothetical protein
LCKGNTTLLCIGVNLDTKICRQPEAWEVVFLYMLLDEGQKEILGSDWGKASIGKD